MLKLKKLKKIFGISVIAFIFITGDIFAYPKLFFPKDHPIETKLLLFLLGLILAFLMTRYLFYPWWLSEEINPFKARRLFWANLLAFSLLFYGVCFFSHFPREFSWALGLLVMAFLIGVLIKS